MKPKQKIALLICFLVVWLLRCWYGTTMFWGEDAFQVYLIGLKWYTSGLFPYWGPDVVYTQSQIPGALQGLLVGGPFFLSATPLAPFLLLNLLSLLALCLFGWYLSVRIPAIPKWFLWIWILTAPWALTYSTHIENPSYLLPVSILFFVCIWEIFPIYEHKLVDTHWAFFGTGFSLFWVMQLHLSWVLMIPYLFLGFMIKLKNRELTRKAGLYFLGGSLLSACTLIPTLWMFGLKSSGGTEQNIGLNFSNLLEAPAIISKTLSFATAEVVRFIGANNPERIGFLKDHLWAAPFTIVFALAGIAQFLLFIWSFFQKKRPAEWNKVRAFMLSSLALVCVSYWFTTQSPKAHAFYFMFPVAIWYSFYCYGDWFKKRQFQIFAAIFLFSGLVFHAAVAHKNALRYGLALKQNQIVSALENRDYTILGTRRESALEVSKWEGIWKNDGPGKFQTGFEYSSPYYMPQNITAQSFRSGNYACKMDTILPFGAQFKSKLELHPFSTCQFSAFLKGNFEGDIQAVFEIKANHKNVYWKGVPVEKGWFMPLDWKKATINFAIPDQYKSGEEVMVYFWLSSKARGTLFADDVELLFY